MDPELQKRFWWVFPLSFLGLAVLIVVLGSTTFLEGVTGAPARTWLTAAAVVVSGLVIGALARIGKLPPPRL